MTAPKPETPDERSWTEFGFRTPTEVEGFREYERMGREVCGCRHMRREHFLDGRGCVHVESGRVSSNIPRRPCRCEGWTAPQGVYSDGPASTQAAQSASGVRRTADGQESA